MGVYINPRQMTKEDWLLANRHRNYGVQTPTWEEVVEEGCLPVCLVDNGYFTAAAIGYSEREFQAFSDPHDRRPKEWYSVKLSKLLEVEPSLSEWLDREARHGN